MPFRYKIEYLKGETHQICANGNELDREIQWLLSKGVSLEDIRITLI